MLRGVKSLLRMGVSQGVHREHLPPTASCGSLQLLADGFFDLSISLDDGPLVRLLEWRKPDTHLPECQ